MTPDGAGDVAGLVEKLRRSATAVYIAMDKAVADDISALLRDAATRLAALALDRDEQWAQAALWQARGEALEKAVQAHAPLCEQCRTLRARGRTS